MKAIFFALLAAALFFSAGASAGPHAGSPLIGDWILDVDSLPMPPQMRPQSVTLHFSEAGEQWATRVEIVDQNQNRMHSQSTLALDGTPGRATGNYWVDVIAAKMPAPNVLVMQFVYESIPRSTRVYSISADGKVLTETEAYFKDDGTPMMRTALFNRSPARP